MAIRIRATYNKTGREVFVTTTKFRTVKAARSYLHLVIFPGGRKRFKNFRFVQA